MPTFGDYIKERRLEKDLGLRQAAKIMEISPSYLSRLESGDEVNPPSEKLIHTVAAVLGADADHLMTLAGRISKEVAKYVATTPSAADFLRTARHHNLGAADFARLARQVKKENKDEG